MGLTDERETRARITQKKGYLVVSGIAFGYAIITFLAHIFQETHSVVDIFPVEIGALFVIMAVAAFIEGWRNL